VLILTKWFFFQYQMVTFLEEKAKALYPEGDVDLSSGSDEDAARNRDSSPSM
jgi:hypothetical protein